MEYYLAIKRNKHATTWMSLKNIKVKEASPKKTTYFMILFMSKSRIGKSTETKVLVLVLLSAEGRMIWGQED